MVTLIRCPYCGHPELDATALYCPVCDGEIQSDASSAGSIETPALGSLSSDSSALELEALLDLSSQTADTGEVLNLAAKAPTLDPSMGLTSLLLESRDQVHKEEVVLARPSSPTPTASATPASTPTKPRMPRFQNSAAWGGHIYLILLLLCIGGLLWVIDPPSKGVKSRAPNQSADVIQGLHAMKAERYVAAIKHLEKATQNMENLDVLPSLALAYARTSQLERSREIMKTYRKRLYDQERKTEEGSR